MCNQTVYRRESVIYLFILLHSKGRANMVAYHEHDHCSYVFLRDLRD